MHEMPLIAILAVGFTAAWLLGLLAQRFGLSPIVGYLLAGVLVGEHTPGFRADPKLAHELAEIGVILLMFGVGLHFHVKDLLAVKGVAIPGAIGQSVVATLAAMAVFSWLGLPLKSGAVIGMAMAVASTVVLMRVLMDADVLNSTQGHVAVGWLIVEDIFTVVLLVIIPILGTTDATTTTQAAPGNLWVTLGIAMLKLAALVAIVIVGGSRVIPWVLDRVARLRSRELFTLTVLVFSIAIAAGSYAFFGASMALGAFLAGMAVAQSPTSHQAAADALPMRDAFAVLFFVSVGMLFDPNFIVEQPVMLLLALGIILIIKPLTALVIVAMLKYSARTALTVAIGLAQIGEFSFILSDMAAKHNLMGALGHNVLVASAIVSISLNPMLFRSLGRIEAWLRRHPRLWNLLNGAAERRAAALNKDAVQHIAAAAPARRAIVVGFGPVGRSVDQLLKEAGLSTVIVDLNMDTIAELNAAGADAIFGNASADTVLEQAGIRGASYLVLTLPHSTDRAAVVGVARRLNPQLRILVRARYLRERADLEQAGATAAVFEEAEAAVGLARLVLADTGAHSETIEKQVRELRFRLIVENMSGLRSRSIRAVMIPWTRVRRLSTSTSRDEVLKQIAAHRFTRWPVVDAATGRVAGYLLTKDLIGQAANDDDWLRNVRPLRALRPDADVASTLTLMQDEGESICVVEEEGVPVGMVTLEDILEQVVGRIEDEYPHQENVTLASALQAGGIRMSLIANTRDEVISELARLIRPERLPPGVDAARLALEREAELSTDLGAGVAVPHARCPGLMTPIVVFGRNHAGVPFSSQSGEPVRLVFLLVTPLERSDMQLSLLSQIARVVRSTDNRAALLAAESPDDVLSLIGGSQSPESKAAPPVDPVH